MQLDKKASEYAAQTGQYVVFDPEQIKSADPVTYDDSGNVIPLSQRFRAENQDIRFSVSVPQSSAEYRKAQKKAGADAGAAEKRGKETVAFWSVENGFRMRKQFEDGKELRPGNDAVQATMQGLISTYGKEAMRPVELSERLKNLICAVSHAGKEPMAAYQAAKDAADSIAADMVENAAGRGVEASEDYDGIRKLLRGQKLALSDANRADLDAAGGYNAIRQRNMGRFFLSASGTPVEVFYEQELSPAYPYYFPPSITNPADQLLQITDVMDRFRSIFRGPYEGDLSGMTEAISTEILQRLYDSAAQDPAASAMAEEHIAMMQGYYQSKLAETKAMWQDQVEQMKRDALQKAEEKRTAREEQRERSELLHLAGRVSRMKMGPQWKDIAQELLGNIDTAAQHLTGTTIVGQYVGNTEAKGLETLGTDDRGRSVVDLTALNAWVKQQQASNPDFLPDKKTMDKLARLDRTQISDLSIGEVRDLLNGLRNLEHEVRTSKKLLLEQDQRDVRAMASDIMAHVRESGGTAGAGISDFLSKNIIMEGLSPIRAVRRLTGYQDKDPLYLAALSLQKGEIKSIEYTRMAYKIFQSFAEDEDFQNFLKGKTKEKPIEITGRTQNGIETVKIIPDMRVSLYLHSLNLDNVRHIERGGITIPDYRLYQAGRVAEAYKRGRTMHLTRSQLQGIAAGMTSKERAYAQAISHYYNDISKPEINRISVIQLGYEKALENRYFPIKANRDYISADPEGVKHDARLDSAGYLKERSGAGNPILLQGATDVVLGSIAQHAKYVGLAVPVRNFGKLYGTNQWTISEAADDDGPAHLELTVNGVKSTLGEIWGTQGTSYIEKMMTDLQSGPKAPQGWAKIMNTLRSNYAGAVIDLNPNAAINQVASYAMAASVVGWGPIAKAVADPKRVDAKKIWERSALLWYRRQGYSTVELGDLARQGRSLPPALNWNQMTDILNVKVLGKAAAYYVMKSRKELEAGTTEFYDAIDDTLNKIILETQPNYDVMERPQLLREESDLVKNMTMFKTPQLQNYNIIYDAIQNLRAKERQLKAARRLSGDGNDNWKAEQEEAQNAWEEAKRTAGWAATATIVSNILVAVVMLGWNAARRNNRKYQTDDGKTTAESFAKGFGGDVISSLIGMVPFGSELYALASSVIFKDNYFGVEALAPSAISDFFTAIVRGSSAIQSEKLSTMDRVLAAREIASSLTKLLGIPAENAERVLKAGTINAMRAFMPDEQADYWYRYYTSKTTSSGRAEADYADMYAAARSGDLESYQKMRDALIDWKQRSSTAEDPLASANDAANAAMQGLIREELLSGDLEEGKAAELLQQIGGLNEEKAAGTIQAWKYGQATGEKNSGAAASDFYEYAEPAGVPIDTFTAFYTFQKGATSDKGSDGKTVSGSKKQKIVDYVDALNLSDAQKDALMKAYNKDTDLTKMPWN